MLHSLSFSPFLLDAKENVHHIVILQDADRRIIMKKIFVLAIQLCYICAVSCSGDELPQEPIGEKMQFSAPDMTDEEQHSNHMPIAFYCDACTAISYQMNLKLKKAEEKTNGKKLKESEYLDVMEALCNTNTWENYGLKTVKGVNRISGPGLQADEFPGMMYGGGKWPERLSNKCYNVIGEIGEDEIYDAFRQSGDLKTFLCLEASNDCVDILENKSREKAKKEL